MTGYFVGGLHDTELVDFGERDIQPRSCDRLMATEDAGLVYTRYVLVGEAPDKAQEYLYLPDWGLSDRCRAGLP